MQAVHKPIHRLPTLTRRDFSPSSPGKISYQLRDSTPTPSPMRTPLDPSPKSGDIRADEKPDGHFENLQRTGADLRAARDAITGGGDPVYFGPEREGARIAAREPELQRVRQERLVEAPAGASNFTGGEHDVWVIGDPAIEVFKRTLKGSFGYILDERVLFNPRTFRITVNWRCALPCPRSICCGG